MNVRFFNALNRAIIWLVLGSIGLAIGLAAIEQYLGVFVLVAIAALLALALIWQRRRHNRALEQSQRQDIHHHHYFH